MRGFGLFVLGFVAGILFTFFGLFLVSLATRNNNEEVNNQFQYVEIKGKNGNVQVHTGMPKDSVLILAGKPDNVRINTIGNTAYETWEYNSTNKYLPYLSIDFEDGILKGVDEN